MFIGIDTKVVLGGGGGGVSRQRKGRRGLRAGAGPWGGGWRLG